MADAQKDKDHAEETVNPEDLKLQIGQAMSAVLEEQDSDAAVKYDHSKTAGWITKITEGILDKCVKLKKPYKYVVNAVIAHRAGAGVHVCSSAYYSTTDGIITATHEMSDTVFCAVTVYYVAL